MTSFISNPAHGVTLGGLAMMAGGKPVTHPGGFTIQVSADGATWGNPDQVIATLLSELSDGDREEVVRYSNRLPQFYALITADTSAGLNAGEKALAAVVGMAAELEWQPPDPSAPPTVFDVVGSRMDFEFDGFMELAYTRKYLVSMRALPWGRSKTKTITPAVTAVAPTVLDTGSSTTNWTAPAPTGAAVSVVSGAVTSTYNPGVKMPSGFYGTYLRRTASIDTSTAKYLGIDWKSSIPGAQALNINDDPFANEVEVRREPLAGGLTRSWYRLEAGTTTVTKFNFSIIHPKNPGSATLSIDQVLQANALPAVGTTRQKVGVIFPGGSIAAEGDVIVEHPTAGLGQTIVFSHPAEGGYVPSLRQWLTSSNTVTTDSSTVSGARHSLNTTASQFDVPIDALPSGEAQLWARIRLATGSAASVGLFYAAHSLMGGVALDTDLIEAKGISLPGSATWAVVPIARVSLQSRKLGPSGRIRIYLLRSTVHDLEIDEAWLFGMERGRLTVVDCGTGTPAAGSVSNRLKITAPSLEEPNGSILVGTAADFSDAYTPLSAKVLCPQKGHRFEVAGTNITTITPGAADADVSLEHYMRWHSNAGA